MDVTAAHVELGDAIVARARATPLGLTAAADGIATIALDEQGRLVEYRPDGTQEPVQACDTQAGDYGVR